MIKPGEKPLLGYYRMSKMGNEEMDSIALGLYYINDGTDGEFTITFRHFTGTHGFSPRLEIFSDGIVVLEQPKVKKLIKQMKETKYKNIDDFVDALKKIGFKNMKEYR